MFSVLLWLSNKVDDYETLTDSSFSCFNFYAIVLVKQLKQKQEKIFIAVNFRDYARFLKKKLILNFLWEILKKEDLLKLELKF